jgi:hypothetical protein
MIRSRNGTIDAWAERKRDNTFRCHPPPGRARPEGEGKMMRRSCFYALFLIFSGLQLSESQADVQRCRLISDPKNRLACFDKETEPVQVSREPPAMVPDKEQRESPSEMLQKENEYLNGRMGTICKGC